MNEENKKSLTTITKALFQTKTPKEMIKHRPGPSGLTLDYVEIGYVVQQLQEAFGPFWEWKIVDKQIGRTQIWVQGELTIKGQNGMTITKSGFGGAPIKLSKSTGQPVSIYNDLKAASSDALKKAASLFGVAADIFYKEMDFLEEATAPIEGTITEIKEVFKNEPEQVPLTDPKPKDGCYQCGEPIPEVRDTDSKYFCSKKCQNIYNAEGDNAKKAKY